MATGPALVSGRIVFPLSRSENLIGRIDRASGIYPDIDISPLGGGRNVSRRHAEVTRHDDGFVLRDLGSKIGTLVNGEMLQDASTDDFLFDVPTVIAHASAAFTLEPGDLILTGTPSGVGFYREPPLAMRPGDVVQVEVERLGVLENPVVAQR